MARRQRELAADRRGGPRSVFWSTFTWMASAAASAVFAALIGAVFLLIEANRPGPTTAEETVVVIPRGASGNAISKHLEGEGVIRSALAFRLAGELYERGRTLKAGEYAVPQGASMRQVVDMLAEGRTLLHPITIPEGLTSAMVVELLAASDVLTGPVPAVPPEGAILPETYKVARGADRTRILQQMIADHQEVVEKLWAKRAKGLPIKTPEEAVILASIVEKETGIAHERPQVAAVFVNRLRKGMRLESDPTIIYGVSQGRALGRGILQSELDRATPYNTYRIDGLPPTPIANPGRDAIAAVLNPPTTTALFFVADGTGGHAFAATYAEHQRNVARWRDIERQRANP